jgi:hypothetical protein
MRPPTQPLDPDSDAGRRVAASLTDFLASVEPKVAARRRARELAAQNAQNEQKAA